MRKAFRLACCALCAAMLCACGGAATQSGSAQQQDFTSLPSASSVAQPAAPEKAAYRAMWISYLDWGGLDCSGADAFAQSVGVMLDNCVGLGLNCVIVQVRPFGDAIYPSSLYPFSSIVTGVQGQDPGFDPLAVFVEQAHARGLAIEAWINPYRIRASAAQPAGEYAASNPAVLHPEWTRAVDEGLYFDPAVPEVRELIVQGVEEIVRNYDVDGIEFDDYFYPTTDASFDAQTYAAQGGSEELDAWRRENVNALVRAVYSAVKAIRPEVIFGISPQGNNDNNYNGQYSDVALWLSQAGYVDYIMPQLYWGFGYATQSGDTQYAYETLTQWWASLPRAPGVSLRFGLGAYRVGDGDGGSNDQSQWSSGHNLADQVSTLEATAGVSGFALYRYSSLFANGAYPELCAQELEALRALAAA